MFRLDIVVICSTGAFVWGCFRPCIVAVCVVLACRQMILFLVFGRNAVLLELDTVKSVLKNKSSLTSTVRNFSLIYLFILFLFLISTTRHVSAHP
jgi:hypothetical protein